MSNVDGTQINTYRWRTVPGSFSPVITASSDTLELDFPTDTLIEVEKTESFYPTESSYPSQSKTTTYQQTVAASTQFTFSNSPVTSPSTFISGGFTIQEGLTESIPKPAGSLAVLLVWRLRSGSGSVAASGAATATEISPGILESITLTAPVPYDISAGMYGSAEIVSISANMPGTVIRDYDAVLKTIANCWGPSIAAPTLSVGGMTQSVSSYFDNINFQTNYSYNVSVTAGGMTPAELEVKVFSIWQAFSFISFTTEVITTSSTLQWVSGGLWRGNTGNSPQGASFYQSGSRKVSNFCQVDDATHIAAILPVTTPIISASYA
jgi:hypothetical protein